MDELHEEALFFDNLRNEFLSMDEEESHWLALDEEENRQISLYLGGTETLCMECSNQIYRFGWD
jgi:hypothetical protein